MPASDKRDLKYGPFDSILLLIRLAIGALFIIHGAQRLFGAFGGVGFDRYVQNILANGMLPPNLIGLLIVGSEFLSGLLILFGLATEVGAMAIIVIAGLEIYSASAHNGLFRENRGLVFDLAVIVGCAALVIWGPGGFALWKRRRR
jgi:putative oxidoreductase